MDGGRMKTATELKKELDDLWELVLLFIKYRGFK